MAAIVSAQSGLSNVGTTWVGGVVPVEGDTVTIALGHTVTITGTHTWGNDVSSPVALSILGACVFSTVADSSLRFKGPLTMGVGAIWRRGTIASPMPANIKSTIIWNYSATPANGEFQSVIGQSTFYAEWSEVGAAKSRQFQLTSTAAIGATSINVTDVTGWNVGDLMFIEATSMVVLQRERMIITNIVGNTVSFATGLVNEHLAGGWGGNLSSNVTWQTNSSFTGSIQFYSGSPATPAVLNLKNVSYHNMYIVLHGNNYARGATNPIGVLDNLSFCDVLPSGTVGNLANDFNFMSPTSTFVGYLKNTVMFTTQSNNFCFQGSVGGSLDISDSFFCGGFALLNSRTGIGAIGFSFKNVRHTNSRGLAYAPAGLVGFKAENLTIDGCEGFLTLVNGNPYFKGMKAGQVYGIARGGIGLMNATPNVASQVTFEDCLLPAGDIIDPSIYKNVYDGIPITVINRNGDTTAQELYLSTGAMVRDNVQLTKSRSSIKFSPYSASTPHGYSFSVPASAGIAVNLKFGLRYDTTYGTATPPTVTVSGLGITPQVFTAGGSANTDYSQLITVVPVTTGVLIIKISGTTTATFGTGSFWFSGMSVNPWIDWTQWYGYAYAPTIPTLTVDPIVVLSESGAIALGSSFASNTLTLNSSTFTDIYDCMKLYEASNRLAPIYTSTDGFNFTSTVNLAITGGLMNGANSNITLPLFSFVNIPTNITLTGDVIQNIPTNLTGVKITGTLTYNTNTNITILITDCTLNTVANIGTGIITINRVNSTIANYTDAEINFIDSTISVIGADSISFHPTANDRDLNINTSGTFTSSSSFKYGATINGSIMSGTLYLRCVAGGIPFNINKTIALGDNLVDLGTTAQLASLSAKIDLTAKQSSLSVVNVGVQKASKFKPHNTNL